MYHHFWWNFHFRDGKMKVQGEQLICLNVNNETLVLPGNLSSFLKWKNKVLDDLVEHPREESAPHPWSPFLPHDMEMLTHSQSHSFPDKVCRESTFKEMSAWNSVRKIPVFKFLALPAMTVLQEKSWSKRKFTMTFRHQRYTRDHGLTPSERDKGSNFRLSCVFHLLDVYLAGSELCGNKMTAIKAVRDLSTYREKANSSNSLIMVL